MDFPFQTVVEEGVEAIAASYVVQLDEMSLNSGPGRCVFYLTILDRMEEWV